MTTLRITIGERTKSWQKTSRRWMQRLSKDTIALISFSFLVLLLVNCLFTPFLTPTDPTLQNLPMRLMPPAWAGGTYEHLLGTDGLGRDLLSRLMYGARYSMLIAASATILACCVGTTLGLIAGYRGGWVDTIIMRIVDIQMSFTGMMLTMIIVVIIGPSVSTLILVLGLISWVLYTRVIRAATLQLRDIQFVEAAKSLGCTNREIITRHILPNVLAIIISMIVLETGRLMVVESSLSFLGFGVQPPDITWGLQVAEGREYIRNSWWLTTFPGLAITVTVLAINFVGIWLRSISHPFQRQFGMGPK
ncbi:ABC transporter permease [Chloroflexota bacterium]